MTAETDYVIHMEHRDLLYRFLSRIYQSEVDEGLLQQLQQLVFPEDCGDPELEEGYKLIKSYLDNCPPDAATDLAVDYARVFLGAGLSKNSGAYPYASFYTSPKHILMQEARDDAVAAYASEGLCKDRSIGNFPEDHLALMLEFMAFLCRKELPKQLSFLRNNLLNWIPDFCADLERYAETSFYRGIAKITNSWLRMDCDTIAGLV